MSTAIFVPWAARPSSVAPVNTTARDGVVTSRSWLAAASSSMIAIHTCGPVRRDRNGVMTAAAAPPTPVSPTTSPNVTKPASWSPGLRRLRAMRIDAMNTTP